MELNVMCKSCQKHFEIKAKALSRQELVPITGEYFKKKCVHCGNEKEYHVNDVKAYNNLSINLIGIFVGLAVMSIITLFIWNKGYIASIGFVIGGLIIYGSTTGFSTSNIAAFNKYRIQATIRESK